MHNISHRKHDILATCVVVVASSSSSHIGVYPVIPVRCARKTMKRVREVGSQLDYPLGP
jgi:hypothetical protein